jgi:tetratricopeptide (TPR) repeat protein
VLADDPFRLDEVVAGLRRFGLVKASEQTLAVHRLLQQVIRDRLDSATTTSRVGVAVRLLTEVFPSEGFEDPGVWPTCAELLPHVIAAAGHAEHHQVESAATSRLLDSAESYLHGRARYSEARALAELSLTLAEAAFGPEHKTVATRLGNLALILRDQGDLDGARTLLERALAIRETSLGADHPETAWNLDRLATVLYVQGDFDRARTLHKRALTILEAHLGGEHPLTVRSRQRFAAVVAELDNQ